MNTFQPGGVTHNPHGYAYGAPQPMNSGLSMLAQMQLLKGFSGDSGSCSSSSSSSKVSIVKYDDHFKEKGWCAEHLRKPGAADDKFTPEEMKKNPPLGLKFGNKECNVVIPIPSHEAVCETTKKMVTDFFPPSTVPTDEQKKQASDAITKALLYNYVKQCDHSSDRLTPECFASQDLRDMPTQSRAEHKAAYFNRGKTNYDTAPEKIDPNFKDHVRGWM
ncbi:unnamed protein product [Ectocarpus sp. 12 AP-2014]